MGQNRFSKELRLARAVVAPDFEHDVGRARVLILLDAFDAFLRRSGDRADFIEDVVGYSLSSRFAATFFHSVGDRPKLVEGEGGGLEKDVGRRRTER